MTLNCLFRMKSLRIIRSQGERNVFKDTSSIHFLVMLKFQLFLSTISRWHRSNWEIIKNTYLLVYSVLCGEIAVRVRKSNLVVQNRKTYRWNGQNSRSWEENFQTHTYLSQYPRDISYIYVWRIIIVRGLRVRDWNLAECEKLFCC